MAVLPAGSTIAEVASATTLACPVPSGIASGDFLIAEMTQGVTGPVPDADVGWTLIGKASLGSAPSGMWYRWATASEPASYTFTATGLGRMTVSLHRYTGVDATTPMDVTPVTGNNNTGTTYNSPSITTVTANAVVHSQLSIQSNAATITIPTETTLLTDTGGVDGRRQATVYENRPTAGATGTRLWTLSNTLARTYIAAALRPSAAPATPTLVSRMLGIPTNTTIEMTARTTLATSVRAQVSTSATFASGIISGSAVTPNAQGDSVLAVTGLTAGTAYYQRIGMTVSGTETFSAISSTTFRTDNPGVAANFSFSFSSCDDAVDSSVFTTLAARNDDFFLHLGDWPHDAGASSYADGTGTTVANFRTQLTNKIQAANHVALYSKTPMDYTPSDHDGMANGSNAGSSATAWTNWNSTVREMLPLGPYPGSTGVYKTWTRNRVRFIKLDRRSFASTPSATDNSSKTCLGATQKQWLKDTITAATEPAIVIVQESPWIGSAVAGDDGWMGYTTERTELASFFAASGKKIIMLAGDMHALAADNGTNAPGGITVWHAAPLDNATSTKGGPYSAGTYPTSGTAVASQYGRCVVTDNGTTMTLVFTGYSADNTQRITQTTTVATPVSETGSLAALVAEVYTNRTSASADEAYDVPTSGQAAALAGAYGKLMTGDFTGAATDVDPLGYDVVLLTDTVTSRSHAVLRERLTSTRFWGLFVWSLESTKTPMVVEAPHTKADANTHTEAQSLFNKANAKAFLMATAHRNSNAAVDVDGDRVSDQANADGVNPFQSVHAVAATSGSTVVQIHGYADATEPSYDIIVSEGQSSPIQRTQDVAAALRTSTSLRVGVYDGTVGAGLGATGNVQGIQSRAAGIYWLHVEQNTTVRANTTTRGLIEDTLASSLLTTPVVSSRTDTYGVRALVTDPNTETYAVRVIVAQSVTDTYAVRALVIDPMSDTYAVWAMVANSAADTYGVRAPVASSRVDTYGVATVVAQSAADTWAVRTTAATSRTDTYAVRTAVAPASRTDTYAVVAGVVSTRSDTYAIRTSVAQSAGDTWAVRGSVTGATTDTYAVRAVVASSVTEAFNVLVVGITTVTGTRTDTYAVRALVAGASSETYAVRAIVAANRSDSWAVRTLAAAAATEAWSVLTAVAPAVRTDTWSVRGTAVKPVSDTWSVRALTTAGRTDTFAVRIAVLGSVADTWRVFKSVAQAVAESYAVRAIVAWAVTEQWDTAQATPPLVPVIGAPSETLVVSPENRTMLIEPETRTLVIPAVARASVFTGS